MSAPAVTVPDEVSQLDAAEVEQRLGRLVGSSNRPAPASAPTSVPVELTPEEILALLNSGTPVPDQREVRISISPRTISRLTHPELTIKAWPLHGTVEVTAPNEITYVPDGTGGGQDSFEYELFDGETPVFSQVVEVGR